MTDRQFNAWHRAQPRGFLFWTLSHHLRTTPHPYRLTFEPSRSILDDEVSDRKSRTVRQPHSTRSRR